MHNVLLVVLDSVRAGSTSLHGHHHETTPVLASLGERATVYDQARAPSNWSLPSHASLFTGVDAHRHGVESGARRLRSGSTVFGALADAGYATGVFSENVYLTDDRWNLAGDFETVVDAPGPGATDGDGLPAFVPAPPSGSRSSDSGPDPGEDRPDDERLDDPYAGGELGRGPAGAWYVDALLGWIDGIEGPWAACLNLMDAHRPYEPRPGHDRWADEFSRRLQAEELGVKWEWPFHGDDRKPWQLAVLEGLYEGAVRQADAALGRLLDGLRDSGALDDSLLVVTADHGEGFGEPPDVHGGPSGLAHGMGVHESVVHVPLVVRAPGQTSGRRVGRPATLTRLPAVVERLSGASLGDWGGADRHEATDVDPAGAGRGDGTERRSGSRIDAGLCCPEGPVLTYGAPISDRMVASLAEHVDETTPYEHRGWAVYDEHTDGHVRRRVAWGDAARETASYDPGTHRTVGPIDPDRVRAAFDDGLTDASEPIDDESIDGTVVDRLRDLGYY